MGRRALMGLVTIALVLLGFPSGAQPAAALTTGSGSISLNAFGSAVSENFNALASTGTSSTLPTGWFFDEASTNANILYAAGTGSSTAGDTYSFGATASTERAFGELRSGALVTILGAAFTNNTGGTITSLAISYTGEQWREGVTNRGAADRMNFEYGTTASSITVGTFIPYTALNFSSPNTTATAGALDGNAVANRTPVSATISGLGIANGATFFIRWTDFDISNSDDGLAIDDFSLTPSGTTPSSLALSKAGTGTGAVTSSPAGISCGTSCASTSAPFDNGTVVTLTATPDATMTFDGFSANCAPTGATTCAITISGAATVTATFTAPPQQFTLTLNKAGTGSGAVTSAPPGISCDASCATASALYDAGTAVTLTQGAVAGSFFGGWSANCTPVTATSCTVTVSAATTVTATLTRLTAIHTIQGSTRLSPMAGLTVTTMGIVTAVKTNGFFMQAPDAEADSDPNTSEGIFVFTGSPVPAAAVMGNLVSVTAKVQDFVPSSDPYSPAVTELSGSPSVSVLSTANFLPAAITLTSANYDPAGGVDQLVKYEGMRVQIDDTLSVVSPSGEAVNEPSATATTTGSFYATFPGVARPFREPGIETPEPNPPTVDAGETTATHIPTFDSNPERVRIDTSGLGVAKLDVTTGAAIADITGALDFIFRSYSIYLTAPAIVVHDGIAASMPVRLAQPYEFTVSSMNMERFFDTVNDPESDAVLTATAFANRVSKASLVVRNVLHLPDVVGVEEVEHQSTLKAVADRINADEIAAGDPDPGYVAYLAEGNDIGGIDSGFLVKTSRVTVASVTQYSKSTVFAYDGSLLNDRPPLVLTGTIQPPVGPAFPVLVIVNHLRSLSGINGNTTDAERVRLKRRAQAEDLARLIQGFQTSDPGAHIISVGDYNAFQFNDGYVDGIGTIKGTPTPADLVTDASPDLVDPDLTDVIDTVPADQRYSFMFDGNAQEIDHVLINQNMTTRFDELQYARNNADFGASFRNDANRPERLSDHDPIVAYFSFPPQITAPADVTAEASAPGCVATVSGLGTPSVFGRTITVTRDPSSDIFSIGTTPVTWTATDGGGTSVRATQHVTVRDTTAPILTAPAAITRGTGQGSTTSTVFVSDADLGSALASDVCGVTIGRSGVPIGNLFPIGTTTIGYSATDQSGNVAVATQTVTIFDDTPPDLSTMADVVTFTGAGATSCAVVVSNATLGLATASDNSGLPVTITRTGLPTGNVFPVGTTTLTYTATDNGGNIATTQQLVTVVDDTPPQIVAPANASYELPALVPAANPTDATAADNCGAVTLSLIETSNGGAGSPARPLVLTRVYTATDSAGNTSSAAQIITVVDDIAPTISGAATPAANANGWRNGPVTVHFTCADNSGTVNCPNDVTLAGDGAGQSVTGTATDGAGNTATTSVGGVNIDRTKPIITFSGPSTYTVAQAVTITCTVTDALSGIASATCPGANGPAWAFGTGSHTLNASATDRADNTATASTTFRVTVDTTSLCVLIGTMVDKTGVANSLCVKLKQDTRSFVNELNAQRGKTISDADANTLVALAGRI